MTKAMGMRRVAHRGWNFTLAAALLAATTTLAQAAGVATHTSLTTGARQVSGHAVAAYSATVLGEDGAPAAGIVTLQADGRVVASAALNSAGKAEMLFNGLAGGEHLLHVVYTGDASHAGSISSDVQIHSDATTGSPDFALAVAPTTLPTVAPGETATGVATITAENQFTGFLSLSCAGAPVSNGSTTDGSLPVGVSCTFTPANLQVTSSIANSANPTISSDFSIQTTAPAGKNALNQAPGTISGGNGRALTLAILAPGLLGVGLLGRKRKFLGRTALLLLVGVAGVLGTSACNARYAYLHHPPTYNGGTPVGSYTLTIWAQTSDGVTASEHFTTVALTVK